jgi:hypothetical protein
MVIWQFCRQNTALLISITEDTYGHLVPGGNRAEMDKLDGLEYTTIRNPDATTSLNVVSTKVTVA